MSIANGLTEWIEDHPEALEYVITTCRPYNVEKRRITSLIAFGVISEYMAKGCLKEFKNREHKEALKINEELN